MTACRVPGVTDAPNTVQGLDLLAHFHADRRQVVVSGDDAVSAEHAVIDFHLDPVAAGPTGFDHGACGGRSDRGATRDGPVQARVKLPDLEDGMEPHAEFRGGSTIHRARQQRSCLGFTERGNRLLTDGLRRLRQRNRAARLAHRLGCDRAERVEDSLGGRVQQVPGAIIRTHPLDVAGGVAVYNAGRSRRNWLWHGFDDGHWVHRYVGDQPARDESGQHSGCSAKLHRSPPPGTDPTHATTDPSIWEGLDEMWRPETCVLSVVRRPVRVNSL